MADREIRTRGLLDRWSHLEQVKLRTPSTSELVSIIAEQVRLQEELQSLGAEVHPAGAR